VLASILRLVDEFKHCTMTSQDDLGAIAFATIVRDLRTRESAIRMLVKRFAVPAATDHAARFRPGAAIYEAISLRLAPIRSSERTIKSMLTDGSAASIFATLD
jgi:hypothetical protein